MHEFVVFSEDFYKPERIQTATHQHAVPVLLVDVEQTLDYFAAFKVSFNILIASSNVWACVDVFVDSRRRRRQQKPQLRESLPLAA